MSQFGDIGGLGRHYLQAESYGAAAFCFYRLLHEESGSANGWNGLVLSLSLMRKENDSQTALARYGLQPNSVFDQDLISFALMIWQHDPRALSQWMRAVLAKEGSNVENRHVFEQIAEELEQAYAGLLQQHGEEALTNQGMLSLTDYASRRMELDWLVSESFDNVIEQGKKWLEDPESALYGVRLLCMLPDPRSEKLLRRVCRNEDIDAKVRTHAVLALRWLGVRGNARISKFGESFVINLDNPEPELSISVPAAYRPALDRMKLWCAKQIGLVDPVDYEAVATADEVELSEELKNKMSETDVAPILQEVAHMLIRSAYDQYYPLVPTVTGARDWAAAMLWLMKDYAEGVGVEWPYGNPELTEMAQRHRNWLLSGSPDFYDSIEAAKQARIAQAQAQMQAQEQPEPEPEQANQ
ncbi:HEAT repeat domain-containing protein [Paenibacillus thalictri]|uniref:HEAT repeat domain-containing protein n=1 Tax=Paenibacillus thalictri TaxID=2527873 RepID=A0A4Q9DNI3_9BACL|nr:HEAT repeat domain-containing protein [Paenibacillus thalictri]TBL75347.1 HEAT repeat domain-containing protein [Paenibacillus thalictri]